MSRMVSLAVASSGGNGSKGNVGLLNEQNKTWDIACQQVATRCHQLQLVFVRYGYLICFQANYRSSKGEVGPLKDWNDNKDIAINWLNHLVPLAVASYSSFSYLRLSSPIEMVLKAMLVYYMSRMELWTQLDTKQPIPSHQVQLAIAGYSCFRSD